jgi:hypothetical protein
MNGRRLATPGAVLFVAGVILMWWGSAVFRNGDKPSKVIGGQIPKDHTDDSEPAKSGSGSNVRTL